MLDIFSVCINVLAHVAQHWNSPFHPKVVWSFSASIFEHQIWFDFFFGNYDLRSTNSFNTPDFCYFVVNLRAHIAFQEENKLHFYRNDNENYHYANRGGALRCCVSVCCMCTRVLAVDRATENSQIQNGNMNEGEKERERAEKHQCIANR